MAPDDQRPMRFDKLAQYALVTAGVLALGFCMTEFLESYLYEATEARKFDRELDIREESKGKFSESIAPVVAPRDGEVIGQLEIPRLGVFVIVVEGADPGDLKHAVGHISGTPLPGESGNVGIAGHRDTFFRPLRFTQRGDKIVLRTLRGTYRYRVISTTLVRPADVQVLNPIGRDTLTLVTCYPFYYVGPAPERFIVRAERLIVE
jgi:sortase A